MYYIGAKLIFRRIAQALSREMRARAEYKAPIDLNVNVWKRLIAE